jgi:hypothetical protein
MNTCSRLCEIRINRLGILAEGNNDEEGENSNFVLWRSLKIRNKRMNVSCLDTFVEHMLFMRTLRSAQLSTILDDTREHVGRQI